jgi:hypothetical protein
MLWTASDQAKCARLGTLRITSATEGAVIRNVARPDFPDVLSISKAGLFFKGLSKHRLINRLALTTKKARREHRALISL